MNLFHEYEPQFSYKEYFGGYPSSTSGLPLEGGFRKPDIFRRSSIVKLRHRGRDSKNFDFRWTSLMNGPFYLIFDS